MIFFLLTPLKKYLVFINSNNYEIMIKYFTCLSLFNFAFLQLIPLQFQVSYVDQTTPLSVGFLAPEPYRAPPAS